MSPRWLLAAAFTALLVGCGSAETPAVVQIPPPSPSATLPAATPAPSPSAKPKAAVYASAKELAAQIEGCVSYEEVEDPIGAVSLGSCYAGESQIVVAVYSSQAAADQAPREKAEIPAGVSDTTMVVGNKWTASCDTVDSCKEVTVQIGGDLVVISA